MSFDFTPPEDINANGFLATNGYYHLLINAVEIQADNRIDLKCEVLAGLCDGAKPTDACYEVGNSASLKIYPPKLTDKNEGAFAKQRQAVFFIATNVLTAAHVEAIAKKEPFQLNPEKVLPGKQFLARLKIGDKGFLEFSFRDIWHVDDARGKRVPKDEESLALLPPEFRSTPEKIQAIKDAFGGGAGSKKPAAPAKASTAVTDYGDI